MKLPTRRPALALCAVSALMASTVPALADSGAPQARAAAKCGTVTTFNGGKARYVNTVGVRCRIGRKVARRAKGKRYTAFGFDCKPRRSEGLSGKLYGCGRVKNGKGQGVGFIYSAPRAKG